MEGQRISETADKTRGTEESGYGEDRSKAD